MQTHPQLPDNIDELKALLTAQISIVQTLTSERDELVSQRNEIKSERDSLKSESETLKSESQLLKQSQRNNIEEIKRLTLLIAKLQRQLFGQKSERLSAHIDQLKLELEELHINEGQVQSQLEKLRAKRTVASHERSAPSRNPLPEHLPRERNEILPESENCADCGTKLFRLSEDMSETLVWVPGYFKVVQNVRPKFTCRCCETFTQAPAPNRPIDRSYASPELLSHIMVSKYLDHLPLYRQCEMFARQGMELSDSTMGDWLGGVHELLEPLMAELKKHVFAGAKLHADDTPIRVLARPEQPGFECMPEMIDRRVAPVHRRCGSDTRQTARAFIHKPTYSTTRAFCRLTPMQGLTLCMNQAVLRRLVAGRTPEESSMTCMWLTPRRPPSMCSRSSASSMTLNEQSVAKHPSCARLHDKSKPNRSSTNYTPGCLSNCEHYQRSRQRLMPSAMRLTTGQH